MDGVAELELRDPTTLHLTLSAQDGVRRREIAKAALETLLAHDVIPRTMAEGARLEERFLEEVGRLPRTDS